MDLRAFSKQAHLDAQTIEALSKSADGQALMAMLQKKDPGALERASKAGEKGDYTEMTTMLKSIMNNSEGRALLQRLAQQLKQP